MILAGGQSLIPAMNFRLNTPSVLIDINRVEELEGIGQTASGIRIGALARHNQVAASGLVKAELPLLAEAMGHVAHPAVRNRGTFGGSLALADPSAEIPACAVALDATLVLASQSGVRKIPARQFFRGLYTTDRKPDEILIEAIFSRRSPNIHEAFFELSRRHGDYAVAGVCCRAKTDGDLVQEFDLVVFGCEPYPHLAEHAARVAKGQELSLRLGTRIAEALRDDLQPIADLNGSAAVKLHLAKVLTRRAVDRLAARTTHG